ncbi:hypothetical protein ACOME3_008868 [Neoechinorhynchus agilis]
MGLKQSKEIIDDHNEISSLVKKTGLEEDVLSAWKKQFYRDCPSGKMGKRDFFKFYKSLRTEPDGKIKRLANFIFKAFDRDDSGYIDFKEFIEGYAITSMGDERSKLEYIFALYDQDKNNTIDKREVTVVLERIYDLMSIDRELFPPAIFVEQIFSELGDSTNKKVISKEEFINGCLKNPTFIEKLSPFNV